MKPFLLAAALLAAAALVPCQAAQPAAAQSGAAQPGAAGPDTITFEQYRDWRLNFIAERQKQLAAELAAGNLSDVERARLSREKAYYDRQAAMPAAQRDRLFRARFDQIDTNHDGVIERSERIAWHEKQAARYRRQANANAGR